MEVAAHCPRLALFAQWLALLLLLLTPLSRVGAESWTPTTLGSFARLSDAFSELPISPLENKIVANESVLEGRETALTAQPFYVLRQRIDRAVVADALEAVKELVFDDHNDEADWLPAYEVYITERAAPVPGAAPEALHTAVAHMERTILPFVRGGYGCPECLLCTAFVRRYMTTERVRVPAHFDVTAFTTIILPLSPSGNYSGGFYVQPTAHINSRQFVPVEDGDIIVHDFTLNHGIEVFGGGRWSLVAWVSQNEQACRGSHTPWHAERARNGDLVAQHILGMMFSQGNGAPQDDVRALKWTLLAAEGGLVNAQFSAATMYFEGAGTTVNESRAFYWYEKAAAQGDASAQMILARMFSEGVGVPSEQSKAEYWFKLGSSQEGASLMGPPRWSR